MALLSLPRAVLAAACVAALAAPPLVGLASPTAGDVTSYLVRLLLALAALRLLLKPNGHGDQVRRPTRLLAASVAAGAAAAVAAVLESAGLISSVVTDLVYVGHVPLALVGLMLVPTQDAGPGTRLRATLDGAIATTSLAFVVHLLLPSASEWPASTEWVVLSYSTGDVFLLATALSLIPRVVAAYRRFLVLAGAGLALLGGANLFHVLTPESISSHGWRTGVAALGVLLVVLAAASLHQPVAQQRRVKNGWRYAALAPFVPTAVGVTALAVVVLDGGQIGGMELALAVCAAMALLARQVVASWDTGQLLERLRVREQAYRQQALEDPLTGLPNRRSFTARVEQALDEHGTATVLLVDCDDFKVVNDTQGHDAGDLVLRHVGTAMAALVGSRGTVARLGGDEFGVLLHCDAVEARRIGAQLRATAALPIAVKRRQLRIGISVGGAEALPEHDAVSSLLAHADVALYRAKGEASDRLVVLGPDGRSEAAGELRLRDEIATPVLEQFSVAYQPLFDAGGTMRGAEALLRWTHPDLGSVSPAVFIPLAEQTGSIDVLGDFVLEQALAQLAAWRDAYPGHRLAVGVNASPRQLREPAFAGRALSLLASHRLDPSQLVVEVTEQAFVADLEPIGAVAAALRAAGVSIAVDDFGTGYSSLRYLESIPSDVLKIDRSFTWALTTSPGAQALVRGVVALARELDLQTIAEGVETVEQLQLLRELGCEILQGFLLARPGPPEQVLSLLAQAAARTPGTGQREVAAVVPLQPRGSDAGSGVA